MSTEPEVGDIVMVPRPTDEQLEAGEKETDSDTILVNTEYLEIVEVREPGFYVVKRPETGEPGSVGFADMMGYGPRLVARYVPTKYVADAWIQPEGGQPERLRIVRHYKYEEVKNSPKRVHEWFPKDPVKGGE